MTEKTDLPIYYNLEKSANLIKYLPTTLLELLPFFDFDLIVP